MGLWFKLVLELGSRRQVGRSVPLATLRNHLRKAVSCRLATVVLSPQLVALPITRVLPLLVRLWLSVILGIRLGRNQAIFAAFMASITLLLV